MSSDHRHEKPDKRKRSQMLNGRLIALTRFISRSAGNLVPFFHTFKNNKTFEWTNECEEAFKRLKVYLATPPILTRPEAGETLYLYLAASQRAVSSVLIREENDIQKSVYFTSRTLQGVDLRYQQLEKVTLTLVSAARKLKPYFQSHLIVIRIDVSIRQIIYKPDLARRMVAWAIELSEYELAYEHWKAIKAQALADFVVEMTKPEDTTAAH